MVLSAKAVLGGREAPGRVEKRNRSFGGRTVSNDSRRRDSFVYPFGVCWNLN